MQEGIYQIGYAVSVDSSEEDRIIQRLASEKKGKKQHILKMNFNTKGEILKIDGNEEIKEDSHKKYLFVDRVAGPNAPQWLVSKNSSQYHISETIPNLTKLDLGQELNEKIKKVFKEFFIDLGENCERKYRYVLNLQNILPTQANPKELFQETLEENENEYKQSGKKFLNKWNKIFNDYIKEKYSLKADEIGLYTILIDDKPIAVYDEYRKLVVDKKLKSTNKKSKKTKNDNLTCSICNKRNIEVGDIKKISLKFFINDKITFSSSLLGDYTKNMIVCEECLNNIITGENYIKDNLNTNIAGFRVYLIPHFIFGQPLSKSELDKSCKWITNSFNTVKNIKSAKDFKLQTTSICELNDDLEDEKSYFLINILFYKKAQQSTKVRRLIKDVNPSIFDEIFNNINYTKKIFKEILGEKFNGSFALETIYYLTPMRVKSGEALQYNNLLYIYDCIFTKRKINKKIIIKNILKSVAIKYFGKLGFNIKTSDLKNNDISNLIIQGEMCLKFLEYMGCIKEELRMDSSNLSIEEDMKNYIEKIGYNEQQTAMFLLGTLIGKIGICQYKSSEGKKPILNKLNFNGIDKSKIYRLTNEVLNKLRQEKILKYNEELIYNQCKNLLDKNLNNWNMDKNENLYYILSGYSYSSTKAILNSKKQQKTGGNNNE